MLALLVIAAGSVFAAGSLLSAPARRDVGAPLAGLDAERVAFASASGASLAAWYGAPAESRPVVVLSHGLRGSRSDMSARALFLRRAGFGVLVYDAQAHGESTGDQITFGFLEAHDARAAIAFVREQAPRSRIGFLGTSLAGASALLGPEPLDVRALVLEAVYPTLFEAVENRIEMRLGTHLARPLTKLLLWQVEPRLGFDPLALNPIDRIGQARGAVLIIAGGDDQHTTLDESKRLFDAAAPPKAFWAIPGAAHVDFHHHAPEAYEDRVLTFFAEHLRAEATDLGSPSTLSRP